MIPDEFCKKVCKGYKDTGKCFVDGECEAHKIHRGAVTLPKNLPKIEPIDPSKVQKLELPDADKFLENLEKSITETRENILKSIADGKPIPKPYFKVRRKDFTKVYECDEYKCDAHPRGCFFCKHSTDIWWDYTNGPYMIMCELQKENDQDMPTFGCIGECKHFEE